MVDEIKILYIDILSNKLTLSTFLSFLSAFLLLQIFGNDFQLFNFIFFNFFGRYSLLNILFSLENRVIPELFVEKTRPRFGSAMPKF